MWGKYGIRVCLMCFVWNSTDREFWKMIADSSNYCNDVITVTGLVMTDAFAFCLSISLSWSDSLTVATYVFKCQKCLSVVFQVQLHFTGFGSVFWIHIQHWLYNLVLQQKQHIAIVISIVSINAPLYVQADFTWTAWQSKPFPKMSSVFLDILHFIILYTHAHTHTHQQPCSVSSSSRFHRPTSTPQPQYWPPSRGKYCFMSPVEERILVYLNGKTAQKSLRRFLVSHIIPNLEIMQWQKAGRTCNWGATNW